MRCEVRTCAESGISVTDGALATLERVLVEGGGDGVRVGGTGAQMQAKECRILRCQMHGVVACNGGTAELTQCETKQNKSSGFGVEDEGSHVTLAACASDFDAQVWLLHLSPLASLDRGLLCPGVCWSGPGRFLGTTPWGVGCLLR